MKVLSNVVLQERLILLDNFCCNPLAFKKINMVLLDLLVGRYILGCRLQAGNLKIMFRLFAGCMRRKSKEVCKVYYIELLGVIDFYSVLRERSKD